MQQQNLPSPVAQLLTLAISPKELLVSPSELARKAGCAVDLADAVSRSVVSGDTIRAASAENPLTAAAALALELQSCAQQYTGCPRTDELVFDECVEFVLERFGFLNVGELRQAFRLAASGELGDVKLEAYFGTFTVGMLGKVLASYTVYRGRVVDTVRGFEKEAYYSEHSVLQSTNWDSEAWGRRRLETLLGLEDFSFRNCTAYDYKYFTESGQMPVVEEGKLVAWKAAFGLAHAEVASGAVNGNQSLRFLLNKINAGEKDEGFKAKRVVIAQQLLVAGWIESLRTSNSVHQ